MCPFVACAVTLMIDILVIHRSRLVTRRVAYLEQDFDSAGSSDVFDYRRYVKFDSADLS